MTETELRLERLVAHLRGTIPAQALPSLDQLRSDPQCSLSPSNADERLLDRYEAKPFSIRAIQYVVEIKQPRHGTTFYRNGHGISEKDRSKATRFNGYLPTLRFITDFLAHIVLTEPVEICIVTTLNNDPWTVEEILAHAG